MITGLVLVAIGVLFIYWGRTRSENRLYRLFIARARGLWGERVHTSFQLSGVVMIILGILTAVFS